VGRLYAGGYFRLGSFRGAPVQVHFSFFIVAAFFCRLSVARWISFFFLILFHELGHAVLVRARRLSVITVEVNGLGGLCHYRGNASNFDSALIAWGGVWAQGVCYLLASGAQDLFPGQLSPFLAELSGGFTTPNLSLMLLNLLPIRPLDGAEAWKLFPLLWSRARARGKAPLPKPPEPTAPGAPTTAPRAPDQEELFQKIIRDLEGAPQHIKDDELS
jgi:hypothetical protein